MTHDERTEKIESYGRTFATLAAALKKFPQEMWQFRPAPKRWSIHEIIVHIADAEANSYVRCRTFLAQPKHTVMVYNQDLWATELKYHEQSVDDSLALFALLRKMSYDLVKNLPDELWTKLTITHPESGIMTLEKWLIIYEHHVPAHIDQMSRNYDIWREHNRHE